ncbi:MAG: hypothetical protein HYV17_08005 [Xanthomonadales bacterium]|nr:hypothetical protein [Xanthomonadales bacterium]
MSDAFAKFFLPYQARWIEDRSRFKIAKKSRRVGLTYAQSFEDVRDAAPLDGLDVWMSSADESAAKEYIRYCAVWAKMLDIGARDLGEVVVDEQKGIKALSIEFANGKRINALTSNPKAFRSKGGKLVLDEFAFHTDGEAMWKAARPIITWGFPVRIISTLNGKDNRYYRIISDTERKLALLAKPLWSLHQITIEDAVNDGLADKILGRKLTAAERMQWLADEREAVGDEDTWAQEYMCQVLDGDSRWLDWKTIGDCETDEAGKPELYTGGKCFVGWDVARRGDGSLLWVNEQVGDVAVTRKTLRMKNMSFSAQFAEVDQIFDEFDVQRMCIDQTGMGEKVVEDAKAEYGEFRVEGVLFTSPVKLHLATLVKQTMQDRRVRIPADRAIRDAHYAVRKVMTAAGNPRFDAERTDKLGHADEFWAHALALHAAGRPMQPAAGAEVPTAEDTYAPEANQRRLMGGFGRDRETGLWLPRGGRVR